MPSWAEILSRASVGFRAARLPEPPRAAPGTHLAMVLKMTVVFLVALATSVRCVLVQFGILCAPWFLFLTFETRSLQPRAFVTTLLRSVIKTAMQNPVPGRKADVWLPVWVVC